MSRVKCAQRMPASSMPEENVKLICVKYKSSDSLGKVKLKLLRAMRKAERRSASVVAITHPLQSWTNPCHSIGSLPAEDILVTRSNSRYRVFLTKDGRVCRLRCASRPELAQQKGESSIASILSSLRRGSSATAHGLSFQEESDAEYARQLQAQFEAERGGGGGASSHLFPDVIQASVVPPLFYGRFGGPSPRTLEELDSEANAFVGVFELRGSNNWEIPIDRDRETQLPITLINREDIVPTFISSTPPPDYRSLFGDRRTSGAPPVSAGTLGAEVSGASGQGLASRGKAMWPEMGSTLEWLVCKQNPDRATQGDNLFVAMAVLHSEILLVSAESRQLYSWSCCDQHSRSPSLMPHPLTEELGLSGERVAIVESSEERATVVTESGKVATFYDALLRVSLEESTPSLIQSLTHPAQTFSEFEEDSIVRLSVSNFITTAITARGKVFWWGLCPQNKEPSSTTSHSSDNQSTEQPRQSSSSGRSRSKGAIVDGSLVRLKNGPPCGPNSIVYCSSPYGPRVGRTMNIIEHGTLDPKTSVLVKVFKDEYRVNSDGASAKKKIKTEIDLSSPVVSDLDNSSNYNGLEVWKLSDVVFLDDSPAILGRVVTIDPPQAIVDISHSTNESGTLASSSNAKSTLKVFKINDMELCPIDFGDNGPLSQHQQKTKNHPSFKGKSSFASSSSSAGSKGVGVSHHVAGTVQHHPVCILAPEPKSHDPSLASGVLSNSLQSQLQQTGSSSTNSGSIIYGYRPLAVHTTDKGPTMLVERISDSATFLFYSGYSSAGSLLSTSFVAVSSKDSKPARHTIEEESVPAFEGGFKIDPTTLDCVLNDGDNRWSDRSKIAEKVKSGSKVMVHEPAKSSSTKVELQTDTAHSALSPTTKKSTPPRRRSSRRRAKLEKGNESATNTPSFSCDRNTTNKSSALQPCVGESDKITTDPSAATESIGRSEQLQPLLNKDGNSYYLQPMPGIQSQLLFLKDVNGKICPLLDGLNLRPSPNKMGIALPTMSYRCISYRQYAISKMQSALVVAVVCSPECLMPAVQTGNVIKVDDILNSIKNKLQKQNNQESIPKDQCSKMATKEPSTTVSLKEEQLSQTKPGTNETLEDAEEAAPSAKRIKISTSPLPKESKGTADGKGEEDKMENHELMESERLKSLTDLPSSMSFETEIQVLEKTTTFDSGSGSKSNTVRQSTPVLEGEGSGRDDGAKVDSLGVLFETTVHNSNVLHVCCQLEKRGVANGKASNGKANESAKMKLSSLLKHCADIPEMSFEEQRHDYMFSGNKGKGRRTLKDLQAMSLNERKLEILESFLSCDEIQLVVIKLLCSRNANGDTPFMTSIHCQNYAAALKILDFVEKATINQQQRKRDKPSQDKEDQTTTKKISSESPPSTEDSKLFMDAVLSPSKNGATPIQKVLASLSPFYDIRSMCLYVSSLPLTYTAQHLLKLFQLRYPSAYKAEIFKRDLEEEDTRSSDEDNEDWWSSTEEEEDEDSRLHYGEEQQTLSHLRRSALRQRRRNLRRRTRRGRSSSFHSRRGIVHFSNVIELRAAAKEMKDYRMSTTISRTTGFGNTQAIHYLSVSLDSNSDSDEDVDSSDRILDAFDDFNPLSRFGNDSLRGASGRGTGAASRRRKNKGKTVTLKDAKLSDPVLAYKLLEKLLSYHSLVIATDNAGETALTSLVHNLKCVQSIKHLQSDKNDNNGTEQPTDEGARENQSQPRGTRTTRSSLGMPMTSSHRPIKTFTTLAELMKSQEEETKTALNIERAVPSSTVATPTSSSTGVGVGSGAESRGTPVMPYVSLADWLDNFFSKLQGNSLEGSLPKLISETQQMLQSTVTVVPGGASTSDDGSGEAPSATSSLKEEDASISNGAQTSILATGAPKTSSASQSSSDVAMQTSTNSKVSASTSVVPERVSKEKKKEVERANSSRDDVKGAPCVAVQILKATTPFVKNNSTKVEDESGYKSDTVDHSDIVLESKPVRLSSPKPLSNAFDTVAATSSDQSATSSGVKLSENTDETLHDVKSLSSSGEQQKFQSEKGDFAESSNVDIGEKILCAVVTSWPSIVATVLGFCPPCVNKSTDRRTSCKRQNQKDNSQSESSDIAPEHSIDSKCLDGTSLEFSSVHTLDSFTTDLILHCYDSTIDVFVTTIIENMNAAVLNSVDIDNEVELTLLTEDVDFTKPPEEVCVLNSHNVALLVGQRFLNSLVRLLGLEHSRVKNAFLEMQQLRQSNAANSGEGRSRNEMDEHLTYSESSFFGIGRAFGRRDVSAIPPLRKNVIATIKRVLGQFSWLAVHCLAEAAEAASAPVRLGVSKPLGASSVLPEYQGGGRPTYGSHMYNMPTNSNSISSHWSIARQLHVRTPQTKRKRVEKGTLQPSYSSLPSDGIVLRPCSKDREGEQGSSGEVSGGTGGGGSEGVTSAMVSGASIHDESFEDDFSDMEGDGSTDIPSTSGVTTAVPTESEVEFFERRLSVPHELYDYDPSSSDDESLFEFQLESMLQRSSSQGGTTEGDNIDDIYPFAWALDGRRIGENSDTNARPSSPGGASIFINTEPSVPLTSIPSIRFGAGFLARTFARFIKDLVDIAKDITDKKAPQTCLMMPPEVVKTLSNSTVVAMEKTWQWVASVLDVAEGQLRQGQYFETQRHVVSLRSSSSRLHSSIRPGQVARVSRSFVGSTPGEYITYLLRTHAREDRECLPVLDLYGYEHVVYMLDGLIYTINHWPKADPCSQAFVLEPSDQNMEESEKSIADSHSMEIDDDNNTKATPGKESHHRFFKRTESVVVATGDESEIKRHNEQFFGRDGTETTLALEQPELAGPPTSWRSQEGRFSQPLNEAYPLAQRPHLLKPFAKKEHLFGASLSTDAGSEMEKSEGRGNRARLSVSYSNPIASDPLGPITMSWSLEEVQQRWHSAISVFAHIFLAEGPGSERSNFLNAKAGFASRMARFRHLVQQLYDASQLTRDWAGTVSNTLSIRARRDHLLQDSIDFLKQLSHFHYVNIRVKFDGEDGSGPGVNRGFFASVANELKSSDVTKQPMNRLGQFFCQPGKKPEQSGLFAPCPFSKTGLSKGTKHLIMSQRKSAFQAIGRFLGLCLWFRYTIPFMVCRHVAKFFLGRELAWHDLAFYNADLYEGLRRMMLDAEEGKKDQEEFVATYCCYFEAPLCGQNSDPKLVELIPGGSKIPVTQQRVKEYVRLYAMFLMVECVKEELQAMKDGLNDIIPSDLLSGLTAEDFQLLLSGGSADINISRLKSVIRFNHTHGNSTTICDRFEKMFWRVVTHMNNSQRQQLLYFATGSATLPVSSDTNSRNPDVAITIDVISSSSIDSLPVASTCSQRMSVPLYPSYHLLKKKLLQAIQCQAYGLG